MERQVVAAVDVGSNSIKMTVARCDPEGQITELGGGSETVRLGAGVVQTGRLAEDRIEAALGTLARFASQARALGASRLVGVATAAARGAANGPAFLDRVRSETGWEIRVITGDEEARLAFRGLTAIADTSGRTVIADIGGGSTEIIVAEAGSLRSARSLPLGSGELTERLVPSDPPKEGELAACRAAALAALGPLDLPRGADARLLVVGGTGEYLARLVPNGRPTPESVDSALARLRAQPATEIAPALRIPAARARVLPAGVAVVRALLDRIDPDDIAVARSPLRMGLLLMACDGGTERDGPREPAAI